MISAGVALEKILLEYEHCHCSKLNKQVTITSMVIRESGDEAVPDGGKKYAFDCDQKLNCGVLTILGRERKIDWTECSHPNLSPG